eukprot:COSAG05_NODE_992_length_6265_cov_7.908693_1_plen_1089_part_00
MDSDEDDPQDLTPGREVDYGALRPDVAWLERREKMQSQREKRLRLNWKYDCYEKQEVDLGACRYTFAFVFKMGVQDDGPLDQKRPMKRVWGPSDPIPLEVWQLCHRMWKVDFHISHAFSSAGDRITILVGLPYKVLIEEATKTRIKMRLRRTKGVHHFNPYMIERYAIGTEETGSPFTSAHRQQILMSRLKKTARANPDDMSRHRAQKDKELAKLRQRFDTRQEIRGRQLQHLLEHFGAFRPFASKVFGPLVVKIRDVVISDPWMLIAPPEMMSDDVLLSEAESAVQYADVGTLLQKCEQWQAGAGIHESFSGTFDEYFPVHDKKVLRDLELRWGSWKFVKPLVSGWKPHFVLEKLTEYTGLHSMQHPRNLPVRQFAPLFQPIDEIRDYFGEHVAMYFAWMELYTKALVWPTILGVVGMVIQLTSEGGVNDNQFTIPYSIFFAAWSISFLSSWTRRENELKFLWGADGYESKEQPRAEFIGRHVVNPETNRDDVVYDKQLWRVLQLTLSTCGSMIFIGFTIYCAVEATLIKDNNKLTPEQAKMATLWERNKYKVYSSLANLMIIGVFGQLYEFIAEKLTRWENHRTQTEFEDSIISKNFGFQFVNNYFVLFYICFIRPFYSKCEVLMEGYDPASSNDGDFIVDPERTIIQNAAGQWVDSSMCVVSTLPELQFQLVVVFTGKTVAWRVGELAAPKVKLLIKENRTMAGLMNNLSDLADAAIDASGLGEDENAEGSDFWSGVEEQRQQDYSAQQIQRHARGMVARKKLQGGDNLSLGTRVKGGTVEATNPLTTFETEGVQRTQPVNKKDQKKDVKAQMREAYADDKNVDDEFMMEPFESTFDEFNEMAVQFGYLALFAPAFPLAPFLALINNLFEIRIDSVKFCTIYRRPIFQQCEDIGAWFAVLNTLGFLAVMTNATMLTFVGSQLADEDEQGGGKVGQEGITIRVYSQRLWTLLVLIEHGIMMMRIAIMKFAPDKPVWIIDAQDTLDFRIEVMHETLDNLLAAGKTIDEIHLNMNERLSNQVVVVEAKNVLKGAIKGLKLSSLLGVSSGPGKIKMIPQEKTLTIEQEVESPSPRKRSMLGDETPTAVV